MSKGVPGNQPSPVESDFDILRVSPWTRVKRLPWVEIALVAGAVGLGVIAGLSHYGVLPHIGSLSQHTIFYGALGGAGGLVIVALAQRVVRQLCKEPIQPIILPDPTPVETDYTSPQGYRIQGKLPKFLLDLAVERLDAGTLSSRDYILDVLTNTFEYSEAAFTFAYRNLSVRFEEGLPVQYEDASGLKIYGTLPLYGKYPSLPSRLQEVETPSEKNLLEILDAYFEKDFGMGTIRLTYPDGTVLQAHYLYGERGLTKFQPPQEDRLT